MYSSLALDSLDNPQISYYDNTYGDLKYARQIRKKWRPFERIDTEGDVGQSTSLALDSGDRPHISYYDLTNGDLKYATLPLIRDVAVTDVTPSKTIVGEGYSMSISVIVENQGTYTETFDVTVFANETSIALETVALLRGSSTKIVFTWDTTGFAYGNYVISAVADAVPGETDTTDNTYTDDTVFVTIAGDVDGDGDVDPDDFAIFAGAYGSVVGDPTYDPECDIDGDGDVDPDDFAIFAANYGSSI
jgi:hypothetical protein